MKPEEISAYIAKRQSEQASRENIYTELLAKNVTLPQIEQAYAVQTETVEKEDLQKRTIHIIVTVAAILIGLGVFSFIAANWQGMTAFLKVFIILVAMIFSYVLGWYLREERGMERMGNALLLVGAIIYGAGIFLVGQIFHIHANWTDGLLLWLLGVMGMGYLVSSQLFFGLTAFLGFVALIASPGTIAMGVYSFTAFLSTTILMAIATAGFLFLGIYFDKRKKEKQGGTV